MVQPLSASNREKETAILIGVQQRAASEWDVRDSLDELQQLSATAGARVVESVTVKQSRPIAATFIGKGKAGEIAEKVKAQDVTTVVFDDDLTPAQGRNLESFIEAKVVDRTQLILDIFAQHAHTREGSLQIELAQLEYLLPRLRRMWTHLERQKGGIGLRGPGEKQLEMDRRRIQHHINKLRSDLVHVSSHRSEQRRGRRRHGWALFTLVGYTNAGKSTLLNALTGSHVDAYNQLFSTLDPTTRRVQLPNNQMALMTDTVGFIKKLPHHLVESFKATLEEVLEADYLVHVIDASHPRAEQQIEAVHEVLDELGASQKQVVPVLNKIDQSASHGSVARLRRLHGDAVAVSARTGQGLEELSHALADRLKHRNVSVRIRLPLSEGKLISDVHSRGKVFTEEYENGTVLIDASVPPHLYGRCQPFQE